MADETNLKEAFARVKTDIFSLGNEIYAIKTSILNLKEQIKSFDESLNSIKLELIALKHEPKSTECSVKYPTHIPTDNYENPTNSAIPTDNPTVPMEVGGLKYPNLDISTRNRGVPTDRQTNQQTDVYERFSVDNSYSDSLQIPLKVTPKMSSKDPEKPLKTHISEAREVLDSLDGLKKEIRLKFKAMTNQEMLVFSTIYQLESEFPEGIEYRHVAKKLGLSESSIRDYTQKLISKGIHVDKIKLNNKKILLKVSSDLRKIASLQTIMQLREL